MSWNLGLDTEGTGLYLKHGCRPFFVSGHDNRDVQYSWEWDVNHKTRDVVVPKRVVREIENVVHAVDKLILWNCKYDLHSLQTIGVRLPPWERIYDGMTELHVLDPSEPNALKPCAAKFLNIPTDDQKLLHQICLKARNIAKKLGWAVAEGSHPHFKPAQGKAPKAGWVVCDMWIPRQISMLPNWRDYISPADREIWLTVCRKYAMLDALRTVLLHDVFWPEIVKQKLVKQFRLQQAAFCPLYAIEDRGFPVLPERLKTQKSKLQEIVDKYEQAAIATVKPELGTEINLRSPKQMTDLLYNRWKLPVIKRTKPSPSSPLGNPSADFETLIKLAFVPEYRAHLAPARRKTVREFLMNTVHYSKINTGFKYLRSYEANRIGRLIYPTVWNQGTSTTRVSFSDPNLQNVGKGGAESGTEDLEIKLFLEELAKDNETLRSVFGPEPGTFWFDIDYSQLQLRIFAFVASEQSLIDAFAAGWDAHTYVARRIFKLRDDETPSKLQRRIAKAVNFGFIFGAQPAKIEQTAGRPGLWDEVISIFPSAHKFMETIQRQVRKYGFVYTPGGYKLTCDKAHKGVNFIVQGSEGEIVKRAMVETHRYLCQVRKTEKIDARLRLQVHDELVFSFPKNHTRLTPKNYEADGKEKLGYLLDKYNYVLRLKQIMEDAGSYYGMVTPVDPEIVVESWDKSYKLLGI